MLTHAVGELGCCLLASFPRALSSHSSQRKELAQKLTWTGSHGPLAGHVASPVISNLGIHGHFVHNDDSCLQEVTRFQSPGHWL